MNALGCGTLKNVKVSHSNYLTNPGEEKMKSRRKFIDDERLKQLAQPKKPEERRFRVSRSVIDNPPEIKIPNTLRKLDENSRSLKKLKYKEQYLQAIRGASSDREQGSTPNKKKKKYGFIHHF
jgi:hypothetical protein